MYSSLVAAALAGFWMLTTSPCSGVCAHAPATSQHGVSGEHVTEGRKLAESAQGDNTSRVIVGILVGVLWVAAWVAAVIHLKRKLFPALEGCICEDQSLIMNLDARIPHAGSARDLVRNAIHQRAGEGILLPGQDPATACRLRFDARPVVELLNERTVYAEDIAWSLAVQVIFSSDIAQIAQNIGKKLADDRTKCSTVVNVVTLGATYGVNCVAVTQAEQAGRRAVETARDMANERNGLLEEAVRVSVRAIDGRAIQSQLRGSADTWGMSLLALAVCEAIALVVLPLFACAATGANSSAAHLGFTAVLGGVLAMCSYGFVQKKGQGEALDAAGPAIRLFEDQYMGRLKSVLQDDQNFLVSCLIQCVDVSSILPFKKTINPLLLCCGSRG